MGEMLESMSLVYSSSEYTIFVAMMSVLLFLTGAMFASFIGLIVHRIGHLSENDSLLYAITVPSSHCEGCRRRLNIIDLLPVIGWIIRRGRCPDCRYTVPAAYPIVEAIAGLCTAAIPLVIQDFDWWVASLLLLLWVGLLVAWIDYEHQIIPEELTWFLLFAGLLMSPAVPDVYDRIIGAALCASAMWVAMFGLGVLMRQNLYAGGDVSFAAVAGAWVGLEFVPWYLLTASVFYVMHSLPSRLKGVKWVAMGPSLVLSLLVSMLFLFQKF